jgi:hypothetical protein
MKHARYFVVSLDRRAFSWHETRLTSCARPRRVVLDRQTLHGQRKFSDALRLANQPLPEDGSAVGWWQTKPVADESSLPGWARP